MLVRVQSSVVDVSGWNADIRVEIEGIGFKLSDDPAALDQFLRNFGNRLVSEAWRMANSTYRPNGDILA